MLEGRVTNLQNRSLLTQSRSAVDENTVLRERGAFESSLNRRSDWGASPQRQHSSDIHDRRRQARGRALSSRAIETENRGSTLLDIRSGWQAQRRSIPPALPMEPSPNPANSVRNPDTRNPSVIANESDTSAPSPAVAVGSLFSPMRQTIPRETRTNNSQASWGMTLPAPPAFSFTSNLPQSNTAFLSQSDGTFSVHINPPHNRATSTEGYVQSMPASGSAALDRNSNRYL